MVVSKKRARTPDTQVPNTPYKVDVCKRATLHTETCQNDPAMKLALAALHTQPDIPVEQHRPHRPSGFDPACKDHKWTRAIYLNSRRWRVEWASLVELLEAERTDVLIDAYLLIEKAWRKSYRNGDGVADLKTKVARRIVRVVRWVLQDRLWHLCCGKDVHRNEHGKEVLVDMCHEDATELVMRLLEQVHLWNGPNSFFYTRYGWLKFTPFLLAAERQNFPLVRYLYLHWPNSKTIDSTSQAGNNAYALCKDWLKNAWGHPPSMIEDSQLLAWLASTGMSTRDKVCEYEAYKANRKAAVPDAASVKCVALV